MTKVVLKRSRDFSVRKHHPWIFSGAIASGVGGCGETVEVCSDEGETLGFGSYSPTSQIRVRMLSFDSARIPDAAWIAEQVAQSVARRATTSLLQMTNAIRLIHAENDGLPGVVADNYDGWIVCQFTSAGAEFWKHTIAKTLMEIVPQAKGVIARNDAEVRKKEGLDCVGVIDCLEGLEPPERIEIFEGAVKYFVDVRAGHKTGFYLDQRDAREWVGRLAKGRDVLNCFSYTGGFGLAAALGGAKSVTQVDISKDALNLAQCNAELNGVETCIEEANVFDFLRKCRDSNRTFDLIVLDPPKFASIKSQVMKAARGYKDINLLAMKLLRPGGILATFSCSGAMTQELFDRVLAEASQDAGRDFQVITRTRQSVDHPVSLSFPEGFYLKGVLLRSMP